MKNRYAVQVIETNEIAGEKFSEHVTIFTSKTLFGANEYMKDKWGRDTPNGMRIIDLKTGDEYSNKW